MNNTKIEWCDATWNPVTGCLHSCEYCYARKIANRYKGCKQDESKYFSNFNGEELTSIEVFKLMERVQKDGKTVSGHYYPDGFHYVIQTPNKVERKFIARGDVRAKQIEIIEGELIKLV